MDSSEFFGDTPPSLEDDKDGYGRYLLDATGKGKQPFTRATTIAKMLDNTGGLEIWKQRKAAKGVASSPALTARAAVTPLDDKVAWREILAAADVHSGGDEKRDLGSAFHTFHEHVADMTDEEYAAVPHELRVTYERYRAELDRLGIREVLTEFTCANTEIGVAGKGDAIFQLADGRFVIGDRKSGRITDYPHAACVQLAIYANADVLISWDSNGATIRQPMPELDKTIALVVDITIGDENTAAVHVYELNIWSGWAAALLSTKIRAWRNRRDLITPYHPDPFVPKVDQLMPWSPQPIEHVLPISQETAAEMGAAPLPPNQAWFEQNAPGQPQPVEPADRPDANDRLGGPNIQPPHAAHPITHQAWSSAEQRNITLNPDGTRADGLTGPQVSAMLQPDAAALADGGQREVMDQVRDTDALLAKYKTKADLQGVLAKVNPGANLARQRKNLAADIVAHPSWPTRRAEFLPGDPVARIQEASDEAAAVYDRAPTPPPEPEPAVFSPVVSNAPGPVPPDPEPQYTPIVTVTPPPQGEANPFLPSQPAAAPEPAPEVAEPLEDHLLRRIGEATTMQHIADIWEEARDAGIGWSARLHQAATVRQIQLTAAAAAQ